MPTEHQFTGQKNDGGIGLYYYGARYYDPVAGRFISADVIVQAPGRPQNLNRYSYAVNNPLRYVDPTGNVTKDEADEATDLLDTLAQLYGIDITRDFGKFPSMEGYVWEVGAWTLKELQDLNDWTMQLAGAMGGADAFREKLGGVKIVRGEGNLGSFHWVQLDRNGFTPWTVAHELAHAWDAANLLIYSCQLMNQTGSYYYFDADQWEVHYYVGGTPAKGATET